MRPGPATRAALLSRTFCLPSFAVAKDHRASALLKECHAFDAHLRLAPQGYDSALLSSLEGGFLRRPSSPGAGALDMHRIPPVIHSRENHRQHWILVGTDSEHHAFDCEHFAAAGKL